MAIKKNLPRQWQGWQQVGIPLNYPSSLFSAMSLMLEWCTHNNDSRPTKSKKMSIKAYLVQTWDPLKMNTGR